MKYLYTWVNPKITLLNDKNQTEKEYMPYDFIYYKILENILKSLMIETKLVIAWGW